MHDITVSSVPYGRESGAIPRRKVPAWTADHVQDDDERLARMLITSWTLATGRILRADVPPQLLSTDELISFWADDQMTAGQAAPSGPASWPGSR